MSVRVVAVDVGSVGPPSKFAWAALDAPVRAVFEHGDNPETAATALLDGLWDGRRGVLLLESPMSVPIPPIGSDGWRYLGKARAGEGNRPWSAGAGAGVLATGIAQGGWMLGRIASALPDLSVTTQPRVWQSGGAQLLLAEAFVSGMGKPVPLPAGQHAADALAAGLAMVERLELNDGLRSDVGCAPQRPFNMLAALAGWAGLRLSLEELHQDVLVVHVRPTPVP
jgi:hypothetical protein